MSLLHDMKKNPRMMAVVYVDAVRYEFVHLDAWWYRQGDGDFRQCPESVVAETFRQYRVEVIMRDETTKRAENMTMQEYTRQRDEGMAELHRATMDKVAHEVMREALLKWGCAMWDGHLAVAYDEESGRIVVKKGKP